MWRRRIKNDGETITLRRGASVGGHAVYVIARVMGYAPDELIGGITQGDRKIFVLAEDVEAGGFPLPFKPGSDSVLVRGNKLTIQSVDDNTHRIGGVLIAYEIRATG